MTFHLLKVFLLVEISLVSEQNSLFVVIVVSMRWTKVHEC